MGVIDVIVQVNDTNEEVARGYKKAKKHARKQWSRYY